MRNIFIVGNGLDLGLGLKTKYSDFYDYVDKWFLKQTYSNFHKEHFLINQKKFDDLRCFLDYLNSFLKSCSSSPQINENQLWSDLELNVVSFFESMLKDGTFENVETQLKSGLKVFVDVLQKYYVYDIQDEQIKEHFQLESNFCYLSSLIDLGLFIRKFSEKEKVIIINFNYTNFLNYFSYTNFDPGLKRNVSLFPIHFHVSSIPLLFHNDPAKYPLSSIDRKVFELSSGGGSSNNLIETKRVNKIAYSIINNRPIEETLLAAVFGTSKKLPNSLNFLSKNKSDFYIDQGNHYPEKNLTEIDSLILKEQDIVLNILGFSFGETDEQFNNWVFEKLLSGKIEKLIFWFFSKDKNKSFANEDFVKTRDIIWERLETYAKHKNLEIAFSKLEKEQAIEKNIINGMVS